MKGRGARNLYASDSKWNKINQLIRDNNIAILALQETHLTEDLANDIKATFSKRIEVYHSEPPDKASSSRGVAFVVNKERVRIESITHTEIIPGRAQLIEFTWHKEAKLRILNVYAPNDHRANEEFWTTLKTMHENGKLPPPNVLMGDFNVVESSIDRLPSHPDPTGPVNALQDLYLTLNLEDAWRNRYPTNKTYTFYQEHGRSASRIDRIYLSYHLAKEAVNWTTTPVAAFSTDHMMNMTTLTDSKMPFVGQGRWVLPRIAMEDENFQQFARAEGKRLIDDHPPNGPRSENHNIQKSFESFKLQIKLRAQEIAKTNIPKLDKTIQKYKKALSTLLNDKSAQNESERAREAAILLERIKTLEAKRFNRTRASIARNDWALGEKINKYWIKNNTPRTPRDIITSLRDPHSGPPLDNPEANPYLPPKYLTRSDQMAEAMKEFYEDLQKSDIKDPPEPTRPRDIQRTLEHIENLLPPEAQEEMQSPISWEEIDIGLSLSASGRAPGMDGIPYDFWKDLHKHYMSADEETEGSFNVAKAFQMLFQDITEHGLIEGSAFAEGWVAPIYKKKDQREIGNYRPITLLNTDHKLLTKIHSLRIAKWAKAIIHPAQAGFIPGRSIFDLTNLAKMMINYGEALEENGVIVQLDQEKAYDRITHDYLWAVLEKIKAPQSFIRLIKNLYESAYSSIMINGVLSNPFKVTRGVRQGDPLSCLLFDIAIEPLAAMLRASNLRGFNIPGVADRLIATLFADDTTVYLSQYDSYSQLEEILQTWCRASGAKFNLEKTEIIPIGTTEYREEVLTNKRLSCNPPNPLPPNARIIPDGELTRSLGAWIGNNADESEPWGTIIKTIKGRLQRWDKPGLSIFGRKLVVGMEVGGRIQYLAKVQGMPTPTCNELTQIIRKFMWPNQTTPPVNLATLSRPKKEGGIGLLDVKARKKAITLTWLKSFLDLSKSRPIWAFVADAILAQNAVKSGAQYDAKIKLNVFLQTWEVNHSHNSKLPAQLKEMLTLAKEFKVSLRAVRLHPELKKQLPTWLHLGATESARTIHNRKTGQCLRLNHHITTVGQLDDFVQYGEIKMKAIRHRRDRACCEGCQYIGRIHPNCEYPHKCFEEATLLLESIFPKWRPYQDRPRDGLSLTRRREKKNERRKDSKKARTVDPSITVRDDLALAFRIFTEDTKPCIDTADRQPTSDPNHKKVSVYTDGSCQKNGEHTAKAGAGIWFADNHPWNQSTSVPGKVQSNQTGELMAILTALQTAPPSAPLKIITDSKYCIDGIVDQSKRWEAKGWIGVDNRDLFKAVLSWIRARTAPTSFKWVKGHKGIKGNEEADRLAAEGTTKDARPTTDLQTKDRFLPQGAQISALSQRLLEAGIREITEYTPRRATTENLTATREVIHDLVGKSPTDATIWKAIYSPTNSRKTRYFLWRLVHNAFRVGRWWENIQNCESRAKCTICDELETMQHILTECPSPGRQVIWDLADKIMNKKANSKTPITMGTIMGANLLTVKNDAGTLLKGATRLLHIVLVESAYLIWKIRCERVIERLDQPEKWHTPREIERRWHKALNDRLQMDRALTNPRLRSKIRIPKNLVLKTWSGTLHDEHALPQDWTLWKGVLVGRLHPEGEENGNFYRSQPRDDG